MLLVALAAMPSSSFSASAAVLFFPRLRLCRTLVANLNLYLRSVVKVAALVSHTLPACFSRGSCIRSLLLSAIWNSRGEDTGISSKVNDAPSMTQPTRDVSSKESSSVRRPEKDVRRGFPPP